MYQKTVHGAVLTKTRNANFYMAQFFFCGKTRKNTNNADFHSATKHTASISEPHFSVLLLLQPGAPSGPRRRVPDVTDRAILGLARKAQLLQKALVSQCAPAALNLDQIGGAAVPCRHDPATQVPRSCVSILNTDVLAHGKLSIRPGGGVLRHRSLTA